VPSLISLATLQPAEVAALVADTVRWSESGWGRASLAGRVVGLYFAQPSTRTRTSFSSATLRMGGHLVSFGPGDLQLATGEAEEDTGMVLAAMLDALVVRSAVANSDLSRLTSVGGLPVVNAMSAEEHPTQALADLATIAHARGRVEGVHVLYVGEVNSSTRALAWALASVPGARLSVAAPAGYRFGDGELKAISARAGAGGGDVQPVDRPEDATDVDFVYTTQWQTTGTTKPDPHWRDAFFPAFQVDTELMDRWPEALFMHDLPARRGDEVTAEVLDGPRSLARRQAAMKLFAAAAGLAWTCGCPTG
jgi:ornithine carbamoyltransferase/carbamoyltransferase